MTHVTTSTVLRAQASWPWRRAIASVLPGSVFLTYFIVRARSPFDGRFTLFDDAMVSMAYGRTLVETGELVWFPGAERVQGFTNPLWTLYMGFLHLIGLSGSSAALAVSITGAVTVIISALLVFDMLWRCLPSQPLKSWTPTIAACTIPFLFPLVFWSLRGMEVGLLALLSILLVRLSFGVLEAWKTASDVRSRLLLLAVISALGILTRLDFAVFIGVVMLLLFVWSPSFKQRLQLLRVAVLPVALVVLLVLAFQYFYFGDWLTNTYHLKMEGFGLADRFRRGLHASAKSLPITILVGLAFLSFLLRKDKSLADQVGIMLSSIWFAAITYSIWVGGDAWEWSRFDNRYLAVALPSSVGAVLLALSQFVTSQRRYLWLLVIGLLATTLSALGYSVSTNPFSAEIEVGMSAAVALLVPTSLLIWVILHSRNQRPSKPATQMIAVVLGGLVLLTATSYVGMRNWVETGGLHVKDDAAMTDLMLSLRSASESDAIFATVWAGSPGYYLQRPVIDLLGKNDSRVATSAPSSWPLYPGHNKWNYEYSVGELRPDVVIDLWSASQDDLEKLQDWGYSSYCWSTVPFRSYVLTNSPRIRHSDLESCQQDGTP